MSYRLARVFTPLLLASPAYAGTIGQIGSADLIMGLLIALVAFAVIGVVFLVLREVMCWYWKINTIVSLLEKIAAHLGDQKDDTGRR